MDGKQKREVPKGGKEDEIIQAGIKTVVYECDKYADSPAVKASKRMLDAAGVRYYQYNKTGRKIEIEV